MTRIFIFACLGGSLFVPSIAHAGAKLTEEGVREFIEKTSTITSGKESEMTDEEIDEYLEMHLNTDARFRSTMRYAIPGFDIQETTMSMDKEDFMEGVHKATDTTVENYENQIQIDEIKISNDGRKATVKTRSRESAKMPVADSIEKEEVPVEGMSTCTQIISLNKKDVIQMYNASCVTDIEFMPFD